jgi:integrase
MNIEMIKERFGEMKLREISVRDIDQFRTYLLSDNGKHYSSGYASTIFRLTKNILAKAMSLKYVSENVAEGVAAIPKSKPVIEYWTKDEFEKVISKIYVTDFYQHLCFVMIWLYYMSGVRVNEGTALWWDDVDFDKKTLRVSNMLICKNKSNWVRQGYTKTVSGTRTVALDGDTIAILKKWKERQHKIGIDKFIFSYDGAPMIKSTIGRIVKRYAEAADVHPITVKGLRHSNASYLINELNVDVLKLSKRMGHSSPEITLRHYSHLWSGRDRDIADMMTGNIDIKTSDSNIVDFNGNQAVSSAKANEFFVDGTSYMQKSERAKRLNESHDSKGRKKTFPSRNRQSVPDEKKHAVV